MLTSFILMLFVVFLIFLLVSWYHKTNNTYHHTDKPINSVKGDELATFPFERMPIMTDTEVIFFKKLQKALPEYIIFGQVQLSRIIMPIEDDNTNQSFWFNRICRMSVDYIIVAEDYQRVLVAIELDDWTHQSRRRQQQDNKKDKALTSAGIAIVRFHGESIPTIPQLRDTLKKVITETN